ncbi:MAG: hypothetical protein KAY32_14310 [Candidatus Eisenbacteria sp.]|nr:hypothetical protein [Candidatus Eisenbacteria bacterium]
MKCSRPLDIDLGGGLFQGGGRHVSILAQPHCAHGAHGAHGTLAILLLHHGGGRGTPIYYRLEGNIGAWIDAGYPLESGFC